MTTFDFVSDVGDIVGAAMALLSVLWTVTLPSAERYAGARVHQRDVGQSSTKEASADINLEHCGRDSVRTSGTGWALGRQRLGCSPSGLQEVPSKTMKCIAIAMAQHKNT